MKDFILLIYCSSLSQLTFLLLFFVFLWAIIDYFKSRHWYTVNRILFLFAIVGILFATIIGRESGGSHDMSLSPFIKWKMAAVEPEYYREMFMNGLLYVSFGLTFPYLLPRKYRDSIRLPLSVTAAIILSTIIEYAQYRWNIGYFEVSDILCNTIGAFAGTAHLLLSLLMSRIVGFFPQLYMDGESNDPTISDSIIILKNERNAVYEK